MEERAKVYGEQLQDPQPCLRCGQLHIPDDHVMRATGKQVSLAWQIVLFGVVLGKAAEYLNDPPLYYPGTEGPETPAEMKEMRRSREGREFAEGGANPPEIHKAIREKEKLMKFDLPAFLSGGPSAMKG